MANIYGTNHNDNGTWQWVWDSWFPQFKFFPSLTGTSNGDTISGYGGNDNIYGYGGNDSLYGDAGNDYVDGWTGNDYIDGWTGNDTLLGFSGNDTILGYSGDDKLYGESGDDYLYGESGNDYISGGTGKDYLSGGSGKDVFDFNSVSDSPAWGAYDTISDFKWGEGDKIDLSTIDADLWSAGNQAFNWSQLSYSGGVLTADVYWGDDLQINLVGATGFVASLDVIA